MKSTRLIWLFLVLGLLSCKQQKKPTEAELKHRVVAQETERLKWNRKTTVEDYERAGTKNPLWDDDAREALSLFSSLRSTGDDGNKSVELTSLLNRLHDSGCTDPLINYLYLRYTMGSPSTAEAAKAYADVAQRLLGSNYSPARKFYGALRAAQVAAFVNNQTLDSFYPMRKSAAQFLPIMLEEKTMPIEEAHDACRELISARFWRYPADEMQNAVQPMFVNWPDAPATFLMRGELEICLGWLGRGGGFANGIGDQEWKLFKEHVDKAEKALEKAWSLDDRDTRVPTQMIEVAVCASYPKDKMNLWFNRAMKTAPDNYDACEAKARYLMPEWFGSIEERLAFGRECVASNYQGRVPLMLVNLHYEIANQIQDEKVRREYWKQPSVWTDVKSSYDRFFELNPEAVGWHHNYALYAYWAEQWDLVNEQVKLFGSDTNYAYFGGKNEFEKMIKLAQEQGGK